MKKDKKLGDAIALDDKRKSILKKTDWYIKEWPNLTIEKRNSILNFIKFDYGYLKPEQLDLIKDSLAKAGIIPSERVEALVAKGIKLTELEPEKEKILPSQKKIDELLEKAIPKSGFIKDYINCYTEITDTPRLFLFWGAVISVATMLGKNAFIEWEARKLYPNLWVVFVAPSGTRKGTAIDLPTKLIRTIDDSLLLPQIGSEEGITKALAEELDKQGKNIKTEIGFVRWQEFAKILKSWSKTQTWQASQEFFIDLYDNKPLKKALSHLDLDIPITSISFLSGSTPKQFSKYFTLDDIEGGFFGRVYLINSPGKRKHKPIPPPVDQNKEAKLVSQLAKIQEHYKNEALSYQGIKKEFIKWSLKVQKSREAGFYESFYSRLETHCMKLSIIYEACLSQKIEIRLESFEFAIRALDLAIECARPLITEEIGLSEEKQRIIQVERYIQARGEVKRRDLMRNLNIISREMDEIEKTLIDRDSIEIIFEKTGMRGPQPKIYFVK